MANNFFNKGIKLTPDSTFIKLNNRVFETIRGTAFITIRPDVATANGMVTLLDPGKTAGAATDAGYIKVSINHVDKGLPTAGFYWVVQTLGTAGQTINTLQSDRVSYGAESTLGLTYDATAGTLKFALNSVDTVFTPTNNTAFTAGVVPVASGLNLTTTVDTVQTIGIDKYSGFLSKIATYSTVFSSEDLKKYVDDPTILPTKDQVLLLDATQLNAASEVNNSIPEVQKLTFGAAAASGVITIDGSAGLNNGAKVVVAKGDSGATIAAKVQTALSESLLFKPQLEKQLVTFSPNTSPATSFLVAGVPVTVGAATYETQTVLLSSATAADGPVSFLGVPTASLTNGTSATNTAIAITAAKAAILGGPIARAAGLTNISDNGAGVLTLTFGGPGGTGNVPTLATSPVSNGITFGPSLDGVTGVASTDTAVTTAGAVKTALDASAFIKGASALGRSIVNNGDGSLTITYNSADGDAKPLVIDSKTTTVKASVDTVQTYNAAGAVGRAVTVDGASILITANAADQNLPDIFTNVGSTGVTITRPNLGTGVQTQEFTSFIPSTFDFEGAPVGEVQRMTFTTGAAAPGETLSFVINGVTQTAVIPANPLGAVTYTTAATAAKVAELLTASIANLTSVDKVTASGDFVDVQFKSVAGNVADLTIPTVNAAKAILTTPQQFAQNLAGETQSVSFTTAQSSGNIIVDGITVAIVSGDTPSQIATKVQKALVDSGVSDAGSTSSMYSIPETQAITFTNAAASAGTITVNGVTVILLATDNTPEMIAAKAALALNGVAGNNYFASADGDTLLVMFDNVARDAPLMTGLVAGTRTGDTATAFSTRTEFDSNGLRTTRVNSDGSLGIDYKPWEGTTAERGNIAPVKVDTTGYFVAEKQTVAVTGTTGAATAPVVFLGIPTADIPNGSANTVVAAAIVTAKTAILAGSQSQALGLTDISALNAVLTLTFGGPGGLGDVPNLAANTVASNGVTFAAGTPVADVAEVQTVTLTGNAAGAGPLTFLGVATASVANAAAPAVTAAAITAAKVAILAGTQAQALGLTDISDLNGVLKLTYGGLAGMGDVPNFPAHPTTNGVAIAHTADVPNGIFFNATNGHYYKFVAQGGITWAQAKSLAEGMPLGTFNGYLATITTAQEMSFIDTVVYASGRPTNVFVGGVGCSRRRSLALGNRPRR